MLPRDSDQDSVLIVTKRESCLSELGLPRIPFFSWCTEKNSEKAVCGLLRVPFSWPKEENCGVLRGDHKFIFGQKKGYHFPFLKMKCLLRASALFWLSTLTMGTAAPDLTTERKPNYNWLAVPYQSTGKYVVNGDPADCIMILKREDGVARCWTSLEANFYSKACEENSENVKFRNLKCKSGFYATYKGTRPLSNSQLEQCLLPPDRPSFYGFDANIIKCDLVINNECYYGLEVAKFADIATHKKVGKGFPTYLWIDEAKDECYF